VLVLLASTLRGWKDALHIVKPDTVMKWHRQVFRLFWRRKSRGQPRKPRISPEVIALIKEMAVENRLWGSPRIRDELLKLGFKVAKRTVQKYMRQARRGLPPGPCFIPLPEIWVMFSCLRERGILLPHTSMLVFFPRAIHILSRTCSGGKLGVVLRLGSG
jgi:hypothetical protein